ncbi:DUF2934 domain-containing protein [Bradyrhizobium sp. LB14.3]
MVGPLTQKDVERRAYHLWEQAGMPKGRDGGSFAVRPCGP